MYNVRVQLEHQGNAGGDVTVLDAETVYAFQDNNPARNAFDKLIHFSIHDNGTFGDALDWLRAGYKVRQPDWSNDGYWELEGDMIYSHFGGSRERRQTMSLAWILATDWTIYQEETANV